jgi:hypothetical protein
MSSIVEGAAASIASQGGKLLQFYQMPAQCTYPLAGLSVNIAVVKAKYGNGLQVPIYGFYGTTNLTTELKTQQLRQLGQDKLIQKDMLFGLI